MAQENSFYDSAAYENSKVIKASAGRLFFLFGYNSGPAQFLQLHNAASLPAEAQVPKIVIPIAAACSFFVSLPNDGKPFGTGIVVCNSSTADTKTIGSANCWFNAQYL